jgi:hypothetical protein
MFKFLSDTKVLLIALGTHDEVYWVMVIKGRSHFQALTPKLCYPDQVHEENLAK